MIQRSIQTEQSPTVIVRACLDVRVRVGQDDRVLANTDSRWGLKIERRGQTIEVNLGSSGEVSIPINSTVKVYAGKRADIQGIQGSVAIYAGWKVYIRDVNTLVHVSAGGGVDIEGTRVCGDDIKFSAGRNLRFHIRGLTDAHLMVNDIGGYWEDIIGNGRVKISLKAGGNVIIIRNALGA